MQPGYLLHVIDYKCVDKYKSILYTTYYIAVDGMRYERGIMIEKMKKNKKDIVIYACVLIIFIIVVLLDIIYYCYRDKFEWIDVIMRKLGTRFDCFGITYYSALGKITNLVGVFMTIVSLLFTIFINKIQRSEKNIYGVTYKEMQNSQDSLIQHVLDCTTKVIYLAPIILVCILNFGLCFTGYTLYILCWLSVLLQLGQYIDCFREKKIPGKVAGVILSSVADVEEWRDDDIRMLDIRLDEMSYGIQQTRSWSRVNPMLEVFIEKMIRYGPHQQAILAEHFCRHLCCGQGDRQMPVRHMWNLCLSHLNQKEGLSQKEDFNAEKGNGHALFWGMLHGLLPAMQTTELCQFIDELLDIRKQGIEVCGAVIKEGKNNIRFDLYIVKIRAAMVLIILEDRLEKEYIVTENIAKRIENLKKCGDQFFGKKGYGNKKMNKFIDNVVENIAERNRLKSVFSKLCLDKQNCWHKCRVNQYTDIL